MGMGGRECSRTRSQSQHGQLPRRGREGTYTSELRLVFQDMARRLGTSSLHLWSSKGEAEVLASKASKFQLESYVDMKGWNRKEVGDSVPTVPLSWPFNSDRSPRNNLQTISCWSCWLGTLLLEWTYVFSIIMLMCMEKCAWFLSIIVWGSFPLYLCHLDRIWWTGKQPCVTACSQYYFTWRWWGGCFEFPVAFFSSQFFGNSRNWLVASLKGYLKCNALPRVGKHTFIMKFMKPLLLRRVSSRCGYLCRARHCTWKPIISSF